MKKIVFVLGNYKGGGMAARATNLSNEFAKLGYAVDIVVTGEMSDTKFFEVCDGVNIVLLSEFNKLMSGDAQIIGDADKRIRQISRYKRMRYFTKHFHRLDDDLSFKIRVLRADKNLRGYFLKNKADAVIAFGAAYLTDVYSAIMDMDCKFVYAEKNAPELEFDKGSQLFGDSIKLLRSADAVIVQTQAAKKFFEPYVENVSVINNPVRKNLPAPYSGKRKPVIVNFCRLSPQKNLELLISAFEKLHEEFNGYRLEIYGNTVSDSEKEYKKRLCEIIGQKGLCDCVTVFPPAADVHQKILDCAMFVSSSDFEGLSNSMIEAMAIGLPCICTDCLGGGTREVMVNGENGLIVPMNDAEEMYKAMKKFIENPDLAEACGKNAALIGKKLSASVISKKWIEAIGK